MTVSELASTQDDLAPVVAPHSCRLCRRRGWTSELVASSSRKLMKCHACGVTFLEPQPEAEAISSHLAERYISQNSHVEINFGKLRARVQGRVASLIQKRRAGGSILDIGCAGGYFLRRYFGAATWQLFGVEPSKFAARIAEQKGLTVYRGELLEVELPTDCFDVVTIFDTLSYFREPQSELRAIRRAMKSDGLLVVEQPFSATHIWRHASRLGQLLGGGAMSLLENGQNFLYDAPSMALLLQQAGFRPVGFQPLPGNKQRDSCRDVLFAAYYFYSLAVWHLSMRQRVLGPNFVVFASPS
jgi:SAM-dependent methyltransferase